MDQQQKIIAHFKQVFPKLTLLEAAKLTGINTTRIHRLFKGAPMRVREWELFYQAISKKQKLPIDEKLKTLFDRCLLKLGDRGKQKILVKLKRLEQLSELVDCYSNGGENK